MSESTPQRPQREAAEGNRPADALPVEHADLAAVYANFVRVSGTPEELVLDFGLNTQAVGTASEPIKLNQRLVLNHYTAKRLWMTLGAALQRHEQLFGQLEVDVNKRVLPSARPANPR